MLKCKRISGPFFCPVYQRWLWGPNYVSATEENGITRDRYRSIHPLNITYSTVLMICWNIPHGKDMNAWNMCATTCCHGAKMTIYDVKRYKLIWSTVWHLIYIQLIHWQNLYKTIRSNIIIPVQFIPFHSYHFRGRQKKICYSPASVCSSIKTEVHYKIQKLDWTPNRWIKKTENTFWNESNNK